MIPRTNKERITLHTQWFHGENPERLALIYAPPYHTPEDKLDLDIPVGEIAASKSQDAQNQYWEPKDTLITAGVNFATALIPAMLGAQFKYDQHTSWAIPQVESILDISIPSFNPDHWLFQAYLSRLEALLGNWDWETYLPTNYAFLGPMDVLAGLLGPEKLAVELYEHPDYVRGLALEAANYLIEMAHYELSLFKRAGLRDGTPCGFNYWLPGTGFLFSEDFCALVSRKHYEKFFLEADIAFCQSVDSAFLHLHSAGLQCLPAILDNPYLCGMEVANDISNRDLQKVIDGVRLIQQRKLPVQISSWEHPLEDRQVETILDQLDTPFLLVALQARTQAEMEPLYNKIKEWPARPPTAPPKPLYPGLSLD